MEHQPALGKGPVAFDSGAGDVQGRGDFMLRKTGEELHLDDAGLAGVDGLQPRERLIDGQDVGIGVDHSGGVSELDLQGSAAAALGEAGARVVDENVAHDGGGDGEKVAAVADLDRRLAEEPDVDFMNQRRGLERVGVLFAGQSSLGENPQLFVNLRDEQVAGGGIALAPAADQFERFGFGFHAVREPTQTAGWEPWTAYQEKIGGMR